MSDISGIRYWSVDFDMQGALTGGDLEAELPGSGVTDLVMFSHGWNNQAATADALYRSVFSLVPQVLEQVPLRPSVVLGLVGVHWPSILFPDSAPAGAPAGSEDGPPAGAPAGPKDGPPAGAPVGSEDGPPAGAPAGPKDGTALTAAIAPAFPAAQSQLAELGGLLDNKPNDPAALHRAAELIGGLITSPEPTAEDAGEQDLFTADPMAVFGHLAALAPTVSTDTQGLPNPFHVLWGGAKEALRAASYYEMKRRAGVVGTAGLGPLVARLAAGTPALRVHLMGHSFGARLVSYSLAGLPSYDPPATSPVKSLLLVQGAFSHFCFAPKLPQDPGRKGGLAGAEAKVDGPLLATFTGLDLAVGRLYPAASLISGTDSEGLDEMLYRWGAVGHDGYQAVRSTTMPLGSVGTTYDFTATRFTNLDSNKVIKDGGPPSGAHSDIAHPEVVHVLLHAAGVLAGS